MTRTYTTDDGMFPEDFVRSGLDHFNAAAVLFGTGPAGLDSAGYLLHMAAELLVKAWLLQVSGKIKAIHCINDLFADLVTIHGEIPMPDEHLEALKIVDKYAQLRYPNRENPTEIGQDDFPMLEKLIGYLVSNLPEPLRLAAAKVNRLQKGGRVLMKKRISLGSTE